MPIPNRSIVAWLILTIGPAVSGLAQAAPITIKEAKPGMQKAARIAAADAIRTAQARFPDATILSGELEKEHGKLIYSFDLQRPGVKGIEEVNVDAGTGTVVNTEHENPPPPKRPAPKPPLKKPPIG